MNNNQPTFQQPIKFQRTFKRVLAKNIQIGVSFLSVSKVVFKISEIMENSEHSAYISCIATSVKTGRQKYYRFKKDKVLRVVD